MDDDPIKLTLHTQRRRGSLGFYADIEIPYVQAITLPLEELAKRYLLPALSAVLEHERG